MFDIMDEAIAVIFAFDRLNYYDYMQVDNKVYSLDSLGTLEKNIKNLLGPSKPLAVVPVQRLVEKSSQNAILNQLGIT